MEERKFWDMDKIIKKIRKWIIIVCYSCLCVACSSREDANTANTGTEKIIDSDENVLVQTDDNAQKNIQEEDTLVNISENTTGTDSNVLEATDHKEEQDIEEDQLTQISDETDEKVESYIEEYINLSDDTEIESCEWMKYGEEQVLRVAIQYKEQPENAYRHKEDYFLFINQDENVSYILFVDYGECLIGAACGFDAHFEDVTFDGEEDLLIFAGYFKGTESYCAYIYENGEFRYESTFERIPSYEINAEKEEIYGSAAGGAMNFSDMTFKYINGEFLVTEVIDTAYGYTNGEIVVDEIRKTTYEYEYINGENVRVEEKVNIENPQQSGEE